MYLRALGRERAATIWRQPQFPGTLFLICISLAAVSGSSDDTESKYAVCFVLCVIFVADSSAVPLYRLTASQCRRAVPLSASSAHPSARSRTIVSENRGRSGQQKRRAWGPRLDVMACSNAQSELIRVLAWSGRMTLQCESEAMHKVRPIKLLPVTISHAQS